MKASIVDLRYHMKDVLRAIDRGETVTVLYRGKERARLVPSGEKAAAGVASPKAGDQPFCGMWKDREDMADPLAYVRRLRQPRYAHLLESSQPAPGKAKRKRKPAAVAKPTVAGKDRKIR